MDKYLPGCTGKIPFVSQAEARTYIRNSKKKGSNFNGKIYKCAFNTFGFEHYHTTHMKKRPKGMSRLKLAKYKSS